MAVFVRGAELFYSVRGSGPTCFVLSGIGTKPYERLTGGELGDRFRLVYVDLRGSGRSTGEPSDLTFEVLADDLEAIRTDLGVERVAVMGHSILGALAVEYGRRRPASVSHVILAGATPSGDMTRLARAGESFFAADATAERKQVLRENLAALPANASLGQVMFAQTPMRFFDPRVDAAPLFAGADARPGLLAHVMGTLTRDWDITVDASSLRVPLFIAHGRYDYTVPYVLWEEIASKLPPRATLHIFDRSGHQPFFEEPERFAAAVAEWMERER
jgi:proline iminopeptidase